MTYAKIEARIEPAGIRVRLHNGAAKSDDFLHHIMSQLDGNQPGTVQERVARTFGVPVSLVSVVQEFSK